MNQRLECNKKMVGKRVYCILKRGFYATVSEALNDDKFIIEDDRNYKHEVSIFDIRQVE